MKRKIIIAVVLVGLVIGGLAGIKALQVGKIVKTYSAMVQPPESVSSAVVREEKWQESLKAVGSVAAVNGVNVTPEIAGIVSEISFQSGAVVAKGDVLVRFDASSEAAQLRSMEAQAELARLNAERMRRLHAEGSASPAERDTAEATWKQYQANADSIRAQIEKKTLRAPFAGRLGIRLVNPGEYVDAGHAVVSLQSLSPIFADFSLPQQTVSQLAPKMNVRLTTDAYTNRTFEGILTAVNPDLDPATRSVRLQATFDNADQLLRPGMFARVEALLPTEQQVLVIPATAVLSAPYGDSVFVLEPGSGTNNAAPPLVARQQFIRPGRARGDFVSVISGLKPGQRVASSGVFKLRNGVAVVEHNDLAPKTSETPEPPDR